MFTFLADEMWSEAKYIQDSNKNKERPGKENSKFHAETMSNNKKGGLENEIQDTQNMTRIMRNSINVEADEHRYKWMNDGKSRQRKIKDNTCFDDILVDCRGILFGKV